MLGSNGAILRQQPGYRMFPGELLNEIIDRTNGIGTITPQTLDPDAGTGGDDTSVWQIISQYSATTGLIADGQGLTYSVSQCVIAPGAKIQNAHFVERNPQGSNSRRTLFCTGTGSETLTFSNVSVDRNGDGSAGNLSDAAGIWATDLAAVYFWKAEVFGRAKGHGIFLARVLGGEVDCYCHDLLYAHTTETDDIVAGITTAACAYLKVTARVARCGRIDQTSPQRDFYSRGVAVAGCKNSTYQVNIFRVDQGVDVSGGAGSQAVTVRGVVDLCATWGIKGANTANGISVVGCEISRCGKAGVVTSGPGSALLVPTQKNLIASNNIRNCGLSDYWPATGRAGVRNVVLSGYPRGNLVENNFIWADEGSSTFTVYDSDEILLGQSLSFQTGCRVQASNAGGALPSGLAAATNYYLIIMPDTLHAKLATSLNNAVDGIAINSLAGGSGVNTITLFSDCDYGVHDDAAQDATTPNIYIGNRMYNMVICKNGGSAVPGDREKLTADRSFYVRPGGADTDRDGNSNTDINAFLTLQAALDYIRDRIDLGGYAARVKPLAGSTYSGIFVDKRFTGGGDVIIQGTAGTPGDVTISGIGDGAVVVSRGANLEVKDITLTSGSGGYCALAQTGARIRLTGCAMGVATSVHASAVDNALVEFTANYSITGAAPVHWNTSSNGVVVARNLTITLTSVLAFASAFARTSSGGIHRTDSDTFVGTATGTRYDARSNGVMDVNGAGAAYLPGNVAGSTSTGGQYV